MAGGDLTSNIVLGARGDEVGLLARNFQRMTESLRGQIGDLSEGVGILSSSASQISTSTSQLASGAAPKPPPPSAETSHHRRGSPAGRKRSSPIEKSQSVSQSAAQKK